MEAGTAIAILTCHNRREKTLACLEALEAQRLPRGVSLSVVLTDDNSTDGTTDAVRKLFPEVKILRGDGTLYWNGGMRLAFAEGMKCDPAFYWWLNDDTDLEPDALARLLQTYHALAASGVPDPIVVGSMKDPTTGVLTYGGMVRSARWHPFRFQQVEPGDEPIRCDAMNGNCVLISRSVVRKVGNLDPVFTQGRGDYDYALRAWKAGCSVWVAPGNFGTCERDLQVETMPGRKRRLNERIRMLSDPKGLPWREWYVFSRRHGGAFWLLFLVSPYVRAICCSRHPIFGRIDIPAQ
jgi:GT2 family glycosyltransferase